MKRSLLASLIGLALVPAAYAQSQNTVTLYGIVDMGYLYTNYKDAKGVSTTTNALQSGMQSTSRWGLKGKEQLSGDVYGSFQLESGFKADTGEQSTSGSLFDRQAWLGVGRADLGEIRFGRQKNVGAEFIEKIDPFEDSFEQARLRTTFVAAGARHSNLIKYVSPKWSGFQVGANYSFATGKTGDTEKAGSGNNTTVTGIAAQYSNGPVFLAATYDYVDFADNSNPYSAGGCDIASTPEVEKSCGSESYVQVGGSYDFGMIKAHLGYSKNGAYRFADGISREVDGSASSWMVGATAKIDEVNTLFASYQTSSKWDIDAFQLGYTYKVSKRTNLYAFFSQADGLKEDGRPVATQNESTDQLQEIRDTRRRQFGLGVRHSF